MLTILMIVIGALLILAGFVGCLLPVLPGPPLAYLALIGISAAGHWEIYEPIELVIGAALVALVTALDFVVPAWGAKRYGASSSGIWGSVAGMLIGMLFFPPFGVFLGAGVGALLGELAAGKKDREALRAAWGVLVGTTAGIILKLAVTVAIAWYFVQGAIDLA